MTDAASDLQAAVAVISRVLKITEPAIQTAHGDLKLAPSDIQSLRFIAEHPDLAKQLMTMRPLEQ